MVRATYILRASAIIVGVTLSVVAAILGFVSNGDDVLWAYFQDPTAPDAVINYYLKIQTIRLPNKTWKRVGYDPDGSCEPLRITMHWLILIGAWCSIVAAVILLGRLFVHKFKNVSWINGLLSLATVGLLGTSAILWKLNCYDTELRLICNEQGKECATSTTPDSFHLRKGWYCCLWGGILPIFCIACQCFVACTRQKKHKHGATAQQALLQDVTVDSQVGTTVVLVTASGKNINPKMSSRIATTVIRQKSTKKISDVPGEMEFRSVRE